MRAWLEKAAAAGDINAMKAVNTRAARAWLEKAAAAGDADARKALTNLAAGRRGRRRWPWSAR